MTPVDLSRDLRVVRYRVGEDPLVPCDVRTGTGGSGWVCFDMGPWRLLESYGDDFHWEAYHLLFGESRDDQERTAGTVAVHRFTGEVARAVFRWLPDESGLEAHLTLFSHRSGDVRAPRAVVNHLDALDSKRPFRLAVRAGIDEGEVARLIRAGVVTREELFDELVVRFHTGSGEAVEVNGREWRVIRGRATAWPERSGPVGGDP